MEAKDRVKFLESDAYIKLKALQPTTVKLLMELMEIQDEISFKAGIREVVEWLERAKKIKVPKYQLKEWGIDEKDY